MLVFKSSVILELFVCVMPVKYQTDSSHDVSVSSVRKWLVGQIKKYATDFPV